MSALTKKTNASSGTPPTSTTASTSVRPLGTCWYVRRQDIIESALRPVEGQTLCPYKGLASYYSVGGRQRAAWSYVNAWPEVERVRNLVSFEPARIDVYLDGERLHPEPGQTVIAHGVDRGLDSDEIHHAGRPWEPPMEAVLEVITLQSPLNLQP
jgi:hypothetical protein